MELGTIALLAVLGLGYVIATGYDTAKKKMKQEEQLKSALRHWRHECERLKGEIRAAYESGDEDERLVLLSEHQHAQDRVHSLELSVYLAPEEGKAA